MQQSNLNVSCFLGLPVELLKLEVTFHLRFGRVRILPYCHSFLEIYSGPAQSKIQLYNILSKMHGEETVLQRQETRRRHITNVTFGAILEKIVANAF